MSAGVMWVDAFHSRIALRSGATPKAMAAQQSKLVRAVAAAHIQGRIGFGIAFGLRLFQNLVEGERPEISISVRM